MDRKAAWFLIGEGLIFACVWWGGDDEKKGNARSLSLSLLRTPAPPPPSLPEEKLHTLSETLSAPQKTHTGKDTARPHQKEMKEKARPPVSPLSSPPNPPTPAFPPRATHDPPGSPSAGEYAGEEGEYAGEEGE